MNYKPLIKEAWDQDQVLDTIPSDMTVREALEILKKKQFSYLPVMKGDGTVAGTFSHRSFAEALLADSTGSGDPLNWEVVHLMEDLRPVSVNAKIPDVIEEFNLKDAVLLTSKGSLEGIITCFDIMKYFEKVAESYLLLRQSELGLRDLMRSAIGERSESDVILKSVGKIKRYQDENVKVPKQLEDLNWQEYSCLATHPSSWPIFKPVFRNKDVVKGKLKPIPEIRNKVFHFRKPPERDEIELLTSLKDWVFRLQDVHTTREVIA